MRKPVNIRTRAQRLRLEPRAYPYFVQISKGRALGYRKTKGSGAWIARRIKRHMRVGGEAMTHDQALRCALEWFSRLDGGAAGRYTLRQSVSDYAHHLKAAKGEAKARAYQCVMLHHVTDELMDMEVDQITHEQFMRWLHGLVLPVSHERPPLLQSSANVVLTKLRASLNYAWKNKLVTKKEWTAVAPFRGADNRRELYLSPEQVTQLLEKSSDEFRRFCKVALLTGARPGEVANIRVRDFIKEHGTLRLNGKTGERTAHLSQEALKLMMALTCQREPNDFMLMTRQGKAWIAKTWGEAMKLARTAAELPDETVVYSLRHYYISRALLAGVSVHLIEKNCGTSFSMITKYYGKFLAADQINMLDSVLVIPGKP